MKLRWTDLTPLIFCVIVWCNAAERLQDKERSFRDLLKRFENETTDGNDDWCSEWCTYRGETFVRPDLTAFCRCEGTATLRKVKRYCRPGHIYDKTLRRCRRLEGGGTPTCVLHDKTCPDGELGIRQYPNEEFYHNYIVCLGDAVIIASCESGYYYEDGSKGCVKGDQKVTIVGHKDCLLAPDVPCEEIGTTAMEVHVEDQAVLEDCGQCYYTCSERNRTHYELVLECVHKDSHLQYVTGETVIENIAIIEERVVLPASTNAPQTTSKIIATDEGHQTKLLGVTEYDPDDQTRYDQLSMTSKVVTTDATETSEIATGDEEQSAVTQIIALLTEKSEEPEIMPTEVIQVTVSEMEVITETSETIMPNQEQRTVAYATVLMTETSEVVITEDPEPIELTDVTILQTDSLSETSEVTLTDVDYQKTTELPAPMKETQQVIITEDITPTVVNMVIVSEPEIITETLETVIPYQEQRNVADATMLMTETPEGVTIEDPESIELTEVIILQTDNVSETPEVTLTNVGHQKTTELPAPITETQQVIITEDITPTVVNMVIVSEPEIITETSETVIPYQEQRNVADATMLMTETPEGVTIEDPESIELTEVIILQTDNVSETPEVTLTNVDHQKTTELSTPITKTQQVIITEDITPTVVNKVIVLEPEIITEISETVIPNQVQRNVADATMLMTETSEVVTIEDAESIELTEVTILQTESVSETLGDTLPLVGHQKTTEIPVVITETQQVIITEDITPTAVNKVIVLEPEIITETSETVIPYQEQRNVADATMLMTETPEGVTIEDPESIELTEVIILQTDNVSETPEVTLTNVDHQKTTELSTPITKTQQVIITEDITPTVVNMVIVSEPEIITETSETLKPNQEHRKVADATTLMTERVEGVITEDPESIELIETSKVVTVEDIEAMEVTEMTVSETETITETVITNEEQSNVADATVPKTETSEVVITEEPEFAVLTEIAMPQTESVSETPEVTLTILKHQKVSEPTEFITETPIMMTTEGSESSEVTEVAFTETEIISEASENINTNQESHSVSQVIVSVMETTENVIKTDPESTKSLDATITETHSVLETSEVISTNEESQKVIEVKVPSSETSISALTEILETTATSENKVSGPETFKQTTQVTLTDINTMHETTETVLTRGFSTSILTNSETSEVVITEQENSFQSETIKQSVEVKLTNEDIQKMTTIDTTTVKNEKIAEAHVLVAETSEMTTSDEPDSTTTVVPVEETSQITMYFPYNNSFENSSSVNSTPPLQIESCKIYKYRPCERAGFFRYRNSCTRHYQCFHSKTCGRIVASRVYECPSCLKFNQHLMACDVPTKVPECDRHDHIYRYVRGHRTTDPMRNCTGPGKYPDPGNPSRYYECIDIFKDHVYRLTVNICPLGGEFDWSKGGCAEGAGRRDVVSRCLSSNYAYDRFDCHKFYLCKGGVPWVNLSCPLDYVFNGYYCQHKTKSVLCNWDSLKKHLYKLR